MALANQRELTTLGSKKSKSTLLPRTTLASLESLTLPLVQEVVLLADFQCTGCQKRVADIITRMNGEAESVVVSVLEKKVTLTCRNPRIGKVMQKHIPPDHTAVSVFVQLINYLSRMIQHNTKNAYLL